MTSGLSPNYLPILPSNEQQLLIEDAAQQGILLLPSLGRNAVRSARVHNEKLRSELNLLLDEDDIELSIERLTSSYLLNPHILRMLPIRRAVGAISDHLASSIQSVLALAIVYDLYLRFIADDRPYIRSDAYEDFLSSKGCERPSELQLPLQDDDPRRVVYFLRYVCIPEVMHDSDAFRSSKELLEERLRILAILRAHDGKNAAHYDTEIRDITRFQIVQQGLLHVERSKFAINTQPIRKSADKNLKESYQRTRDLAAISQVASYDTQQDEETLLRTPINELTDVTMRPSRAL